MPNTTKKEIARLIQRDMPQCTVQQVEHMIELYHKQVSFAMARGSDVQMRGFGTYKRFVRKGGKRRNPATNEEIIVGDSVIVKFKTGAILKQMLTDAPRPDQQQAPPPPAPPMPLGDGSQPGISQTPLA